MLSSSLGSILLEQSRLNSLQRTIARKASGKLTLSHGRVEDGLFRLLVKIHALPEFDHQERPYFQAVVAPVFFVLAEKRLHGIRAKDSASFYSFRRQELPYDRLQLAVEPLRQRRIEAHLLLGKDFFWQYVSHDLAGNPLGGHVPYFHALRHTHGKFHEPVVCKRCANFERIRHRHTISVFKTVAAQERRRVHVAQPTQRFQL